MTNGLPLSVRAAIKPISTLTKPLRSVDTETKEPAQALRERTDSTVVPAAAIVAEAMVCLTLARCYREKFGGDHIDDVHAAIDAYKQRIDWRG
jgi:chorismate synthase